MRTQRAATRHPFVRIAQERQVQSQRAPAGSSARPAPRRAERAAQTSFCAIRLGHKVSGAGLKQLANARLTERSLGSGRLGAVRRPRAAQAENLGAAAEIDGVAGALACGGRGLASPSTRAISSGTLDINDRVCKTDELDGRVDGVRAREQQRLERGCMHGGKTLTPHPRERRLKPHFPWF